MVKTMKIGALLLIAAMISCSCARNSDFYGGVLLDSAELSEIKSEVFATTSSESSVVSESYGVTTEQPTETSEIHDVTITEQTSETVHEQSEESCETTENESECDTSMEETVSNIEEDGIVYWTKSGGVWHTARDCRYIKNSEVESGAVDDAIEEGKERVCSSCGK